jgi:hypothetical protein
MCTIKIIVPRAFLLVLYRDTEAAFNMMPYFAAVEVVGKHEDEKSGTHVPSSISNKIMIFMLR